MQAAKIDFSERYFAILTGLVISVIIFLSGCSVKGVALRSTVALLEQGPKAFYEEQDVEFAQTTILSQLKLLETLYRNNPCKPKLVEMLAQGFGAYAFLFLEEQEPERAKYFYRRGFEAGSRYFRKRLKEDLLIQADLKIFDEKLNKVSKKDAPILFWTAYCWGGLINLSRDDVDALAALPKVERIMMKVEQLLPGYFYGGSDLFLGSYYGSRPVLLGGDLEKSKFHFDRALQTSRRQFLFALVMAAKNYAVSAQDRALYKSLLEEAESFQLDQFPEQRLSNEIAKIRAAKMLEEIDERF